MNLKMLYSFIDYWLSKTGLSENIIHALRNATLIITILLLGFLLNLTTKILIKKLISKIIKKSKTTWDDVLLENNFIKRLSLYAPTIFFLYAVKHASISIPLIEQLLIAGIRIYMISLGALILDSLLSSINQIYNTLEVSKSKPIKGYIQTIKIIVYFVVIILILSIILNKNPAYFLTGLGAFAAVLMLVFKDPILGFVASIQLSANNMIKIGDWIEMPKYGADGDVIDVGLTTIKIQNWDKTITTIPPYAFVSESFKNWRGMQESGGRRIKRSIIIDMQTIKFCNNEMLERFRKIRYIAAYIEKKKEEIKKHNEESSTGLDDFVNQRRLTNIGTYRAYIQEYLRNHPMINKEMTFLVRQLSANELGLPIEIYVFCNDKRWANYEGIQADIFDHLLAIIKEFDLAVFQNPSGNDFKSFLNK